MALKRTFSLLAVLALLLPGCGVGGVVDSISSTVGGSSALPAPGTQTAMSSEEDAFAREVLRLVNVERGNAGLGPVVWDDALASVAYLHSVDMDQRDFFDHVNPSGQGPGQRFAAAGITGLWTWGENIARGQRTPVEVMTAWMNSPGHRANILDENFTLLGVGVHSNGDIWWTQDFGAR